MTTPNHHTARISALGANVGKSIDVTKYAFQLHVPAPVVVVENDDPTISTMYVVKDENGSELLTTYIWTDATGYFCEIEPESAATIIAEFQ